MVCLFYTRHCRASRQCHAEDKLLRAEACCFNVVDYGEGRVMVKLELCALMSRDWYRARRLMRLSVSNVVILGRKSGAQAALVLGTHFTDSTIVAFLIVINRNYVALCTHRIFSLARASHLSKQFRQSHDGVKLKINTENREPDSPLFRL
ncbi:hypothetical protein V202x_47950 [Gimesia aquarii]|uniref:Uncharacterized protein n=1 Tax=Gimesia aquarii TaxID=2527964 RepID=A0A517X1K2_9PLAN|nr:hypothetical protein V202x_47950 [Gimesia aquarii]